MPNASFSVPEISDLQARVKIAQRVRRLLDHRIHHDRPRRAADRARGRRRRLLLRGDGASSGAWGRLLGPRDDGRNADGAAVLTYRFWTSAFKSDPGVIGKVIRLSDRPATVVGVLEPSVPYPQETEIIANVVTSPHHLDATMVEGRVHRMTELFGRLAPGASLDAARAELRAVHGGDGQRASRGVSEAGRLPHRREEPARPRSSRPRSTILLILLAASGLVFIVACSNVANLILARSVRREGELAIRAALGASTGALRRTLLAESLLLCGAGAVLRGRDRAAHGRRAGALRGALLGPRARRHGRREPALGRRRARHRGGGAAGVRAPAAVRGRRQRDGPRERRRRASRRARTGGCACSPITQIAASFVLVAGAGCCITTLFALQRQQTGFTRQRARGERPGRVVHAEARGVSAVLSRKRSAASRSCRASNASRSARSCRGAIPASLPRSSPPRATRRRTAKKIRARGSMTVSPGFFDALGVQD